MPIVSASAVPPPLPSATPTIPAFHASTCSSNVKGTHWTAVDLGSKNGTMLNGQPLTAKTTLKSGDRIMAGHLILICDGLSSRTSNPVVIFDAPGCRKNCPTIQFHYGHH